MAINMSGNFLKLLFHFRRHDLLAFEDEHRRLYDKAKETGDHGPVTSHYYSVMSTVIDEYFNGNFHFAAPRKGERLLEDALRGLHQTIGEELELKSGVNCIDIGCGIGGVIRDLKDTGANLTGITIAANEVEIGNTYFRQQGIDDHCRLIEADCHQMPLENESQDSAYAIYSLKYFPKLDGVMKEVARVLKPGGKFAVYDLIKTNEYSANHEEHRKIIEGLEFACGMPSLHTKEEMIAAAAANQMTIISSTDLAAEAGLPFYFCFTHSSLFMWMVKSPVITSLIQIAQGLNILPKGFHEFNRTFLSGTVDKIVEGGRLGILSGSELIIFQKN
ncbi:unnamed protein product, partial [Mesorhabditis belari]|uniref:SAM-dependent methyltransferase Erg6/SMT-type domain-containing protein n=1 Tax=Mesorhabditis belari TaxID=2138241 RepID=A0AAF3E9F2_9BILA